MAANKTQPTNVSVKEFLAGLDESKRLDAEQLIVMMESISGEAPVMWGPSIIGFGKQEYHYDSGRSGEMPKLSFSPRKTQLTIYFNEGFDRYATQLSALGKHTTSVGCLYVKKLEDIDVAVLGSMLHASYRQSDTAAKPESVEQYVAALPEVCRPQFDTLRALVRAELPKANEVLSYGIVGYKIDEKRARVFISGWKSQLAMYPLPKDEAILKELAPHIKGKGTAWFALNEPLPEKLIKKMIRSLVQ